MKGTCQQLREGKVCGNPTSKSDIKTCRLCWRSRGRDLPPEETTVFGECGHPVSSRGARLCQGCARLDSASRTTSRTGPTDALSVTGDDAVLTKTTTEVVRTLADLIRVCQIDTNEWEIERWVANKWEVGMKEPATGQAPNWRRDSNKPVVVPLFQIKAWLKRNRPVIFAREQIALLIAEAKTQIAPRPAVKRQKPGAHMLEVAIPDLHLGKLAWAPETGWSHYDSKIATRIFFEALEALIARTAAFSFDKVVFPIGNDFFHSDTKQSTTTKGTPLDTDSRYHKIFVAGRRMIVSAIERLRQIAPVEVLPVPGNHDTLAVFHLGDSLECYYHNTPDVAIMNEPASRKYVRYGRNLILFTHGDKGKRVDYPLLMATERPEWFGQSKYREIHIGHTHELRIQERMGVRVRISPALCAADAWHSEMHLVGNHRAAEAFVWSREDGIVSMATYTVPDDADRESRQETSA